MKETEKELFKSLCSFRKKEFDETLLSAATPTVLGHLFFNRMQAVAYGTLREHNLLGKVNREFRNSLKGAYEQNIEKNNSFFNAIQYVEDVLSACGVKYAMLKGAYLCKYYPLGYRTSNDIDLLVHPRDVTKIGLALLEAGFLQGNIRNGKFQNATRKDIIESKMMNGETVPYIKEICLPDMQYLEVDINFSLDYKSGDTQILSRMLENVCIHNINGLKVKSLCNDDFFIHLCGHLYKETTTYPWVEMMRDMSLYKYCDVYMLLNDVCKEDVDLLFERASNMMMEKICSFAILQMNELFDFENKYAVVKAETILQSDPQYLHTVISPKDNKKYIFKEKDISERFFADNRKDLLEEVDIIESIKNDTK